MVRSFAYVVFVLPVVFTIVFSSMVLIGALTTFERELIMWPGDDSGGGAHDIGASALASKYDTLHANGQIAYTHYNTNSGYAMVSGTPAIYHDDSTATNTGLDIIYGSVDRYIMSANIHAERGL